MIVRCKIALHLSIHKEIPVREFEIEKDAERNKSEQRSERSFLATYMESGR